ncbi:FbpB family small basic protein [Cytobacillus firmus]|nr:FbpB family small basic protein [Cytobacillus firmus]
MKKKIRYSLDELIKRNKEELLRDKLKLEQIEERLDERHESLLKAHQA